MKVNIAAHIDSAAILRSRGMGTSDAARILLANEVARLADPYVPMEQGTLKNTVQVAPDGSHIDYNQPYAHYQHEGREMAGRAPKHYTGDDLTYHGAPMRGAHWEKRMMADRGDEIADAVADKVGGKRK